MCDHSRKEEQEPVTLGSNLVTYTICIDCGETVGTKVEPKDEG